MKIFPIILAGGEGSRLAPLSTPEKPKAFVKMPSGLTMLEETCARFFYSETYYAPSIILNARHTDFLQNDNMNVIAESEAGGTAMAIVFAALYALECDKNAFILICPCDHYLEDINQFHAAIAQAKNYAHQYHVLFGIEPKNSDTALGYIHKGESLGAPAFKVQDFKEKPDLKTAEAYVRSGKYFWNSGIFLLSAEFILKEIEALAPEVYSLAQKSWQGRTNKNNLVYCGSWEKQDFSNPSIDYAVFEKSKHMVIVPLLTHWSDLGTLEKFKQYAS